jgi:quercetin dioxygenase-like cupin family protein
MKVSKLGEFKGGWFLGAFQPTLLAQPHFEVCIKRFRQGDTEPEHSQKLATEWTVIISGRCLIGNLELEADDIVEISPGEVAGFEALTDVVLVAVKSPSIPDDKVLQ